MFIAFKTEIIQKLLQDPDYRQKLDPVTTEQEYVKLIRDFAQAKRLRLKEMRI